MVDTEQQEFEETQGLNAEYYEGVIKKLKQELAVKDQIIQELTAKLEPTGDKGSESARSFSRQNTTIPLRKSYSTIGNKGYQQIHSKGNKSRDGDSRKPPSQSKHGTEHAKKIITLKENSEHEAALNKLREENHKLAKFYNEHRHLEDKLLKSKELIDTLLKELNHYKEKAGIEEIAELDIDLHAMTLMSHSKLLGAQLDCIQGKVSNLSLKVFKPEHVCACGKSSAKPFEADNEGVGTGQKQTLQQALAEEAKLARACDDQKKLIKKLKDKNKESDGRISFYVGRIKDLEQHVRDLSAILEEWCTKVIIKRN
eukprot:TRINITY_DN8485_c0_g1_i12.p1 TRINITY_DN8485_c0_g1~~TRINITY_DN8485_c0_g1_i12.p1  ORF type:complete len:313 (+),score=87.73 TRINITY_DN8485_c0_g1_i12:154-1092(+)